MPKFYHNIHGWFDFENLYDDLLLNILPNDSTFVEVGSWAGKSVCYLAELAKEHNKNTKIFSVDIFAEDLDDYFKPYTVTKNQFNIYTCFLQNLGRAGVMDRVIPIALFSEDAAKIFFKNSIDCVFLDATHDEENVIKDLDSWIPRIKVGGYLCGHDYKDGIQPFVDKYFKIKLDTNVTDYPPHSFIWKKDRELKNNE